MKTILVTGGTGFIGSHTCVELLKQGYDVIVVDNLCNSSPLVLERIEQITSKKVTFYKLDLLDKPNLENVFQKHPIDAVIHFAGLKAVGESTQIPILYYHNNLTNTLNLLDIMQQLGVYNLVFSSSATVYGDTNKPPYTENSPLSSTNPYGQTKVMIEQILQDTFKSNSNWNISLLRYFNPVGAHPSGLMGEDPNGIPNNLMPFISQTALGLRKQLSIFGGDYPTHDGTGVRDYIHVVDLAKGHLKALQKLSEQEQNNCKSIEAYNLGTGVGFSVLDILTTFEEVSSRKIPYQITERRAGDLAEAYANTDKAYAQLNWKAELTLEDMCRDAWNWQSKNPNGYQ